MVSFLIFSLFSPLPLHLLFFLIWLKPNGRSSLKVQFLIFIPPKPQAHLTTSRSACGMRWLKWFNILMIFSKKKFVYYIPTSTSLIRILSPRKVLGHTKKKNERNKRGLHVYTWVFLTLLRVFVVNQGGTSPRIRVPQI
jgi:hypothetical protein